MPAKKSSRPNTGVEEKRGSPRGPRPSLSREQIAQSAIRVADREGLAAVTMQRIAREVGLTTMALYRYFPEKSAVVALMIDSVADSPASLGIAGSSWTSRLKEWAHRCLAIYEDHPWFLEATTARQSPMGPNELAWMEAALDMLTESGLKPKKRHHAFLAVIGHVRGHATFLQAGRSDGAAKDWTRELTETVDQEPNRYPALLQVLRSGALSESAGAFDFGLVCILQGIRAHVVDT